MNAEPKMAKPYGRPPKRRDMMAPDLHYSAADYRVPELPQILRETRAAPLRTLLAIILVLFAGALIGISSAYLLIERERPFLAVTIGPWSAYPKAGTAEADPYSVAIYTRSARVPLASGEGLALTARTDSSGQTLDPSCTYRIHGQTPSARLWTLSATNGRGQLTQTVAGRSFITSRQLLRREDGSFTLTASAKPRSGNWLPLAQTPALGSTLMFVFRLYDAPVTTGSALDGAEMPAIERVSCP